MTLTSLEGQLKSSMKGTNMKLILMTAAAASMALASQAASLSVVEVDASSVACLFNTNCTNISRELSTPIFLPRTTGTGYVHSRVLRGEAGSTVSGHFGYEYSIDLSGVVAATNHPTTLTNVVKCDTEDVTVKTNVVTCTTNLLGSTSMIVCTTNRTLATNIVTCVTNVTPGTNIQQCITNALGAQVCFTNIFPAVTNVVCFTNRIPAQTTVACQTNTVSAGFPVLVCVTNTVRYRTNLTVCVTNITTTPDSAPCISALRIHVGSVVTRLDLNGDGTNTDNIYVVTTGGTGTGTNSPAGVDWDDGDLVIRYSPPLCAGDAGLTVGFVARTAPQQVSGKVKLTSGGSLSPKVLGPGNRQEFDCDFSDLAKAVRALPTSDFTGSNRQAREAHRSALLDMLRMASNAAQNGNADNVLQALGAFVSQTDGKGNDWLTGDGRDEIKDKLKELVDCLNNATDNNDDGDDDQGDDNDDDDSDHHGDEHHSNHD